MERRKTSATTINASTTSRSNHDIEDVKVHHKHHHRGSSSSKNISRGLRVVVSSLERRLCLSAIRATKNCHSTLWCSTLWACFILVVYSCVNILPPEESMTDNHRILYQDLPGDLDDPTMPSSSSSSFIRSGASPRPSHHPRMIGYYFESIHSESFIGSERLDPNTIRLYKYGSISQKATTDITPDAILRQEHLQDSHDYNMGHADVFESDDCIAQYEWQKSSQPSCNLLLELDMQIFPSDSGGLLIKSNLNDDKSAAVKLIANGYWRDVWEVTSTVAEGEGHQKQHQQKVVLKTIRYEHDYDERNYDRHRRDAVAMERLTKSKYVMDIYGFCGNSGLFEYADGGSIEDWLWHSDNDSDRVEWTSQERLGRELQELVVLRVRSSAMVQCSHTRVSNFFRLLFMQKVVAHQLVSGLVATHNSDKPNVPAIAHADITPSQFVFVKELGIFKLNDFNRCRFIRINKNDDKLCPVRTVSSSINACASFRRIPSFSHHLPLCTTTITTTAFFPPFFYFIVGSSTMSVAILVHFAVQKNMPMNLKQRRWIYTRWETYCIPY